MVVSQSIWRLSRFFFLLVLSPTAFGSQPPLFEKDVLPILVAKCGKCHSDTVRKGDLNLSTMAGVLRGGESGEPAVTEESEESMLWAMIDGGGMPPEGEPQLTNDELSRIHRWLETGAHSEAPVMLEERQLTQHDVLPILLLRCTTCHGPRHQEGGLDLRSVPSMKAGGSSGPAFVPGDPDASLMIQRIESGACPPTELLLKFFVKRPPSSEVGTLRDWITAGGLEVDVMPDVATNDPDPLVTDEDRQHWAFQPPRKPEGKSSIDDFIGEKLREHGLTFSPEADRDTLIRRAYLDLVGLPPSVTEWKTWRTSPDQGWYARMIDHLLDSPHYGERWGRYWLDLAGYADSEGGVSADPIREVAWKYRDYVITSLNRDKPYDRFLVEQLAGDELVDVARADQITNEMVNNLIATGFLRMGIDQTGSRTMNFVPERLGVISDAIEVVGSGILGLTLECAKCHSHKYDPIPQRDYYRLKAIFQGAFDEHDWLSFKNRFLEFGTPSHQKRVAEENPPLLKQIRSSEAILRQAKSQLQVELLRQHAPELSESDRQDTLTALKVADNQRTLRQRTLVEKLQTAEILPDSAHDARVLDVKAEIERLNRQIAGIRTQLVPPLKVRALWDRGVPSPTYILQGGEPTRPGRLVGPGVPSVLTDGRTPFVVAPPFPDGTPKTGRRLAFAQWLVRPDHPLTARVLVNRVWYHHFGKGLVASLENFGRQSEPPSHPELLDWLAVTFVERGWSLKDLHRLIMNSRTYTQSGKTSDTHFERDPENELYSRMPLRRMNAEAIRDSLLFIAGKLDDSPGGPPDPVSVDRDGLVSIDPLQNGNYRRSVYAQFRRTEIPTMMETFDYPEMGPNCVARSISTVSPQSLMLMNHDRIRQLARDFATRVQERTVDPSRELREAQVEAVYQTALSRMPTDIERQLGIQFLKQAQQQWQGNSNSALETYCHTILNSAAFLYID
ncbi:MAG: PSD1 domain-containing protein [Planctomycetaceae bacterium]|nr:PSD1 domain-containing protein [Planctomycetaceae bacterium]